MTKFKENICHKIIDRLKTEDLVRSFNCDIKYINNYLLKNIPNSNEVSALREKYSQIIDEIKKEGLIEGGRTKKTKLLIRQVESLAEKLNQEQDSDNLKLYLKAKPYVDENKATASLQGINLSDIEICFNACYGLLLLKLEQKEVTKEMQYSVNAMGEYLAYLGNLYEQS